MKVKILKFLIAILLLPFCFGGIKTLGFLSKIFEKSDVVWIPILAGGGCWLLLYAIMPKPMRVYVIGHELTHAIWTWIFGGKVKRFKVTSKGGYVAVTKENFLIYLSPYFFPIYAILVCTMYGIASIFMDMEKYRPIFHFLLGAAYVFHITFTVSVLQTKQSDISAQGRFFSWVIIAIGNLLVLAIALPVLSGFSVLTTLEYWLLCSIYYYEKIVRLFLDLW